MLLLQQFQQVEAVPAQIKSWWPKFCDTCCHITSLVKIFLIICTAGCHVFHFTLSNKPSNRIVHWHGTTITILINVFLTAAASLFSSVCLLLIDSWNEGRKCNHASILWDLPRGYIRCSNPAISPRHCKQLNLLNSTHRASSSDHQCCGWDMVLLMV